MMLTSHLTEQILEKLRLSCYPAMTVEGLAETYRSWCRYVPFDNIRKRIMSSCDPLQPLPGATAEDFFTHWIKYGTGGTCWAGHGALHSLLATLGFSVGYGISTMLSDRTGLDNSPGHGTLTVKCEDKTFITDATMLHGEPLPLQEWSSSHPVWGTRVHQHDGYWCVNWKPLGRSWLDCRLLATNVSDQEYPLRHERSRHNSRFDGALLIRLAGLDSISGIVKGEHVIRNSDGVETKASVTDDEQRKLLIEFYGISEEIVSLIPENQSA